MFFNKFKNDNMSLLYCGNFSDDVTTKFINLSEFNIESHEELSKMKRKVSFLIAECFQNIVRHGEKQERDKIDISSGFFMTKNLGKSYFICSGNLIDKKNIEKLEGQLNKVNSLNRDELKELYRQVMDTEQFSSKGGAGLGLIDIARKSGEKIDFSFNDFDDDYSMFYNQIKLKVLQDDESLKDTDLHINDSINFHNIMDEKNILLIQKGDFSQDSILPVLNVIEQNFRKDTGELRKNGVVYHVLVELLQNISKHSSKINDRNEGIFLIGHTDSGFTITVGNFVEMSKVSDLKHRLNIVKNLNKEELKELYLKELTEGKGTESGGAGIGLIDIARESSEPIEYVFNEADNNTNFFSIKVTI
ncbi:MAG: SiaB family protein kinase [Calditrichales bacterium]|nr:SiaB family protein kinase [Calditrichales bacterium]